MEDLSKRIAYLSVISENQPEIVKLTHLKTEYKYINVTIEYFSEYYSRENIVEYENLNLENIEISQTNLQKINDGKIFEITIELAQSNETFTKFAKEFSKPTITPYFEDKFLIDNINDIELLNYPVFDNQLMKIYQDKKDLVQKTISFLFRFKKESDFREILNKVFKEKQLYYDIYDVNGFFSLITDDDSFNFYIDFGDKSFNFLPVVSDPFCVFVSHFHDDHFNLLNNSINSRYYILPYGGNILYNGIQRYPGKEIRILQSNVKKSLLLLTGLQLANNKPSKLMDFQLTNNIKLYLPLYLKPTDRNLESICFSIENMENSVFYPGDTKHYMYYPYLKNFDYFIASHHGGHVGKLNLNTYFFPNTVVNTYYKNIALFNRINQPITAL